MIQPHFVSLLYTISGLVLQANVVGRAVVARLVFFYQLWWERRADHGVSVLTAELRADMAVHYKTRRHIFQPFADFITDEAQGMAAVRAAIGCGCQVDILARQFRRQQPAPVFVLSVRATGSPTAVR